MCCFQDFWEEQIIVQFWMRIIYFAANGFVKEVDRFLYFVSIYQFNSGSWHNFYQHIEFTSHWRQFKILSDVVWNETTSLFNILLAVGHVGGWQEYNITMSFQNYLFDDKLSWMVNKIFHSSKKIMSYCANWVWFTDIILRYF